MNDTVTRLMDLADEYAHWNRWEGEGQTKVARQALEAELTRLFTPLSDEQIENLWPSPEGTNSIRLLFRICENAHGIGGRNDQP